MQVIEGLTDAEIAEAHRSKDIFDEVRDMTAPLDAILVLIHALDWLDFEIKRRQNCVQAFFTGSLAIRCGSRMGKRKDRVMAVRKRRASPKSSPRPASLSPKNVS